ncbi:acyl-CoA dehydrogenase family protein [Xanthobacter flavus]|uniref:acyl-CoA dehydrogenase family protein n=1 Tax=Xanthobacter flavus TaxID=281 RepID=UPI00372BB46A
MEDTSVDSGELKATLRRLIEAKSSLQAVREHAEAGGGTDRALWAELAELGWLGLLVPEAYGGLGLGLAEAGILYEELGRSLSRVPVLPALLAVQAIADAGDAEQKARWLPAITTGELAAGFALPDLTPAGAVSRIGADGVVDGVVPHVLFADSADLLFVPVVDAQGARHLAALAPGEAGVSVERRPAIDLTRDLCTVSLDGAVVPADRLLSLDAAQWSALFDHAAVALACDAVGGALHILERTAEYMRTRVQFDRPIGSFQALKHRAATWKIQQEAATALARHAISLVGERAPGSSAAASAAKFYAGDVYAAIAGDAVQLHGGIGFTWEHECHLFLKRAKLGQVLFGSSTGHKERVAELLFAAPAASGAQPVHKAGDGCEALGAASAPVNADAVL